jgi:hypothetical protein
VGTARRRRLNSAHLIAVIALFVALGGTTWAAVNLGKGTVKAKNLAKNAVTTKKIKDGAVTAPKSAPGVIPSVSAMAFAKVNSDGTLVAGQSKNVVNATKASGTGRYCIDASGPVSAGVATPTTQASSGVTTFIQIPSSGACPTGTDAEVITLDATNVSSNQPFFVVLY